jgi:putative ABC transport system permease protein
MSDTRRPPRLARALLAVFVPRGWAGASLVADLEDEFRTRVTRSVSNARLWYWKAALQVVVAYAWARIRREGRGKGPSGREGRDSPPVTGPAGANVVDSVIQDLRFAVRSFRRTPGFTLVAMGTIALGIASATSVFSIGEAVLLRRLPFPGAERLVHVWVTNPERGERRTVVSGATYLDWAREARSFEALAAYRRVDFNVTGGELPDRVHGVSVTPEFFSVLGLPVALGRLPSAPDPVAAGGTVVLADAVWRSRFGGDRGVVGRSIVLDGTAHTVAAVLPPGISFPEGTMLYVPSPNRVPVTPVGSEDRSEDRGAGYLSVLGRLRADVGLEAAQSEMSALADRLAHEYPQTKAGEGASVVPLRTDLVGDLRPTFALLLGAVVLLLLIVCANVANLLAVRATRRRRELAVRVSVGASRGRLRRQLLAESVVLAFLGGVPGFAVSVPGTHALVRMAPEGIPRLAEASVDPRVLLFALLATLATGLVFGVAPMVGLSADTASGLMAGGGRRRRARPELLRDVIVVTEVALSLLLVVGAGLMIRTFRALDDVNPGFDPSRVLVAHVSLPGSEYGDDAQAAFYDEALERIRALPGVESAATILTLPVHWAVRGTFAFSVEGRVQDPGETTVAGYQVASPGIFRTLRIPLLEGRAIEESDREGAPVVAVVNDAMARRYWPDGDAVGARITFWGDPTDPDTEWATVVGISGNVVKAGLDQPPEPEAYLPVRQIPMPTSTFVVRSDGDPHELATAVRLAVNEVDSKVPLYDLQSMEDVLATSLDQRRFRMRLLGAFAGAALLLAAVGLYGVVSFSVSQRTREIGIRMALGAARDRVVAQVVRHGLTRVGLGLLSGMAASAAVSGAVESLVFGVSTTDPATYATATVLLAAVAVVASLGPALRAARADPAVTVRVE